MRISWCPIVRKLNGGAAARFRYDVAADRWWWSPETFGLLGLPPVAPTADLLVRVVHREDRARVRRALADSCIAGTPFALEHRVLHADGRLRTVVLVGEPETAADGGITALSGMLVDITDGLLAEPPTLDERIRVLTAEVERELPGLGVNGDRGRGRR